MEKKDVVDKIMKIIKRAGGKCYKTDGDYKPDIFGCYKGRCIVIECKDTGKLSHVTEGQQIELDKWAKAGAVSVAMDNPEKVKELLEAIDANR